MQILHDAKIPEFDENTLGRDIRTRVCSTRVALILALLGQAQATSV